MNPNKERVKFVWLALSGKGTNKLLQSLEGFHRLPVCAVLAPKAPSTLQAPPPSLSPRQGHLCLWGHIKGFHLKTSRCFLQTSNSGLFKLIFQKT